MTRKYAMLQLLALGPLTIHECYEITGWPQKSVRGVLQHLRNTCLVDHDGKWGGVYRL